MKYCEDCGCVLSRGICSNCQEEFYIEVFQGEYIEEPLTDDFRKKADEQRESWSRSRSRSGYGLGSGTGTGDGDGTGTGDGYGDGAGEGVN